MEFLKFILKLRACSREFLNLDGVLAAANKLAYKILRGRQFAETLKYTHIPQSFRGSSGLPFVSFLTSININSPDSLLARHDESIGFRNWDIWRQIRMVKDVFFFIVGITFAAIVFRQVQGIKNVWSRETCFGDE